MRTSTLGIVRYGPSPPTGCTQWYLTGRIQRQYNAAQTVTPRHLYCSSDRHSSQLTAFSATLSRAYVLAHRQSEQEHNSRTRLGVSLVFNYRYLVGCSVFPIRGSSCTAPLSQMYENTIDEKTRFIYPPPQNTVRFVCLRMTAVNGMCHTSSGTW